MNPAFISVYKQAGLLNEGIRLSQNTRRAGAEHGEYDAWDCGIALRVCGIGSQMALSDEI